MNGLPHTPSFRLDGRRALVTGASRGIGLGCAMALAEAGAHVICASRGQAALDETVAAIRDEGLSAEALVLDITDIDRVADVMGKIGPLDVFVNSAGTARHAPALETEPDNFDAVMEANFRAAYFCSREAAKAMIAVTMRMERILSNSAPSRMAFDVMYST